MYIFPEGTRSYSPTPDLLPFKKGAFHLAIQAQVPIVPIIAANYAHILSVKQRRFEAGVIPVKVLTPIETKGLKAEDVDDLTRRTREVMLEELRTLSASTGTERWEWNGSGLKVKENGGVKENARRAREL